jgi:hypothetical protein
MEAYGMVVNEVCRDSGLPYYYGPETLTFVGCVLFNDTNVKELNKGECAVQMV